YNLQGGQEWKELYDRLSTGPEGPNLKPNLPEALTDSARLLALQIALSDICALDPAGPQAEVISVLRRKLAHRAARSLASYQNLLVKETSEIPALDWRSDLQPAEGDEDSLRSLVHSAWPEVKLEAETVRESTRAFLTIMLSGDDALIHDNLPAMEKLMRSVPWDQLILATSISPLPLAHALGQEKGFWDPRVECSLGEKSFGGIYGIEFNEGYELLPADGPRPEGWESKPAAFPKIVLDLENKEKQQNQPSPTSKTRSAKNDNGRGRKPATGSGNGNDSGEKVAQKNGDSEKSRQPGKRRSRGRRNRRRSSNNPNGRSQNKPNNSSNSNS
ncbi:MAG: hypothetical protein JXA52_07385, partial [Planctomycetes bacterium]|nr:hypothetical protein [Planctomycetota bacterium]